MGMIESRGGSEIEGSSESTGGSVGNRALANGMDGNKSLAGGRDNAGMAGSRRDSDTSGELGLGRVKGVFGVGKDGRAGSGVEMRDNDGNAEK